MKRPNFFIVGAPKCGTTALHAYLSGHPRVFMPEAKEPHFFSSDLNMDFKRRDEAAYLRLFSPAGAHHLAVGEASVWYLFSDSAAGRIRRWAPEARLIVMLRNPVEMYRSLHNQFRATVTEDQADAERAWRLQEARSRGASIPPLCEEPLLLQYGACCKLGEQAERLLAIFPRRQVHLIVFEDFVRNTGEAYREVLRFLDLPDDGRSDFPPVNLAYRMRWPRLGTLHRAADRLLRTEPRLAFARRVLQPLRPLTRRFRRVNVRPSEKSAIRPEFRRELVRYFSDDIDRLSSLLGRDLSSWKAVH